MEERMAKEQTFEHPPRGHVAWLAYDSVNDCFRVVHVDEDGNVQVDLAGGDGLGAQIYGWDGADWQKLLAESEDDPNLRVRLYGGSTSVNVALANADDRSPNYGALAVLGHLYGWDGSGWDRLQASAGRLNVNPVAEGVLIGFIETVAENVSDTNLPSGTNNLVGDPVPSGYGYVVSSLAGLTVSSSCTRLTLTITVQGVDVPVLNQTNPTSGAWYMTTGQFVLGPGDSAKMQLLTCTAGDYGFFYYSAHKFAAE